MSLYRFNGGFHVANTNRHMNFAGEGHGGAHLMGHHLYYLLSAGVIDFEHTLKQRNPLFY